MNKSYLTAIKRTRPSYPIGYLFNAGHLTLLDRDNALDYGCGHGKDADYYGIDKYDPHFFPTLPKRKYDKIFCTYVLNVVTKAEQLQVLKQIKRLLNKGGSAYITVRRDVKGVVRTSKGTYQRNVKLDLPVLKETKAFCIYHLTKGER